MAIYELDGKAPKLGQGAWVADSAEVIGQVELGDNASVWFGTIIRGARPVPAAPGPSRWRSCWARWRRPGR